MIPDTQFFPTVNQIGDIEPMGDIGSLITKPNGEKWLMTGQVLPASGWPDAAVVESLKVTGYRHAIGSSVLPIQIASDGGLNAVMATGAANVLVTNDGWQTWSSVTPTGLGGVNCTAVVWTGTVFIAGGRQVTQLVFGRSATGAAGTWATAGNVTGTTSDADSIRGAFNGTVALFVGSGHTSAAATVNAAGTVVTGRTLPAAVSSIARIAACNGVFMFGTGAVAYYTTPDGITYTARSAIGSYNYLSATSSLFGMLINGGSADGFYTSPDAITWTKKNKHGSAFTIGTAALSADANRFYVSGSYSTTRPVPWLQWSADGELWTTRWLTSAPVANAAWGVAGGKGLYPMVLAGSNVLRIPDFSTADFVGYSQLQTAGTSGGTGDSTAAIYYAKIGDA